MGPGDLFRSGLILKVPGLYGDVLVMGLISGFRGVVAVGTAVIRHHLAEQVHTLALVALAVEAQVEIHGDDLVIEHAVAGVGVDLRHAAGMAGNNAVLVHGQDAGVRRDPEDGVVGGLHRDRLAFQAKGVAWKQVLALPAEDGDLLRLLEEEILVDDHCTQEPMEHGRAFGPDRQGLGVELIAAVGVHTAGDDAALTHNLHSLPGKAGDAALVREVVRHILPDGLEDIAVAIGKAQQEGGHLLPGDGTVGAEAAAAGAAGDAVPGGPVDVGSVVDVRIHVPVQLGQIPILIFVRIDAGVAAQNRDEHSPGHGPVGVEGGCRSAVEQAHADDPGNIAFRPMADDIVHTVTGGGYTGKCADGHSQRQQKAEDSLSHSVTSRFQIVTSILYYVTFVHRKRCRDLAQFIVDFSHELWYNESTIDKRSGFYVRF